MIYLYFPYGEWVILFLLLATWVEKQVTRRLFLSLAIAWLIGKYLEIVLPSLMPWHWHFARLAVILVFWVWAVKHTKRWVLPLLLTSFIFSLETLFLVNEPGVFPYGSWFFMVILILVAWLTAKTYWGTAAALAGSALLNQALVRFVYEGIVRHVDLPDSFVWNFGVIFLTLGAGLRQGCEYFATKVQQPSIPEQLLPVEGVGASEQVEERELQ